MPLPLLKASPSLRNMFAFRFARCYCNCNQYYYLRSSKSVDAEGGGGGLPLTWACDTIFTLPSGPLGTVEAQGTVCVNRCAVRCTLVAGVLAGVVSLLSYQYEARCRAISQHASLQEFCCACASAHEPYGRTRAAGTSHNSQNESSAAPAPEHAGLTS